MAKSLNEAARASQISEQARTSSFFKTKFFKILLGFGLIFFVFILINLNSNNVINNPTEISDFSESSSSSNTINDNAGKGGEGAPEVSRKPVIVEGELVPLKTLEGVEIFVPSEALSVATLAANAFLTGDWAGVPVRALPPGRADTYSEYTLKTPLVAYVAEGELIFVYEAEITKNNIKSFQIPVSKENNSWFYIGYN